MNATPTWFDQPQSILHDTRLVERFLRYVRVHTCSDEDSETCPSTARQLDLARMLAGELQALGLDDAAVDDNGYVFATLPGTGPTIGLLAHMDTAPDFSGEGVQPIEHRDYQGEPLRLGRGVVIDPEGSPALRRCLGDTILTADGTTLLGADDKAGIAEIMTALEVLVAHPEIPRPTLRVGFTPDEEIGRGADRFDVERFGALVAYTVDGGFSGEVNSETFSADKALVTIEGVAVHPGEAKDKLVNALDHAGYLLDSLPKDERPETTEGRQGFFHPLGVRGDASRVEVHLILRDFDDDQLTDRGRRLMALVDQLQVAEPRLRVRCEISAQYRNMASGLSAEPRAFGHLMEAVRRAGVEPSHEPIRGGTDGSRLSAMGLPTPNLFAGGVNFHGPQEWVSTRVMAEATCALLNLAQLWAQEQAP